MLCISVCWRPGAFAERGWSAARCSIARLVKQPTSVAHPLPYLFLLVPAEETGLGAQHRVALGALRDEKSAALDVEKVWAAHDACYGHAEHTAQRGRHGYVLCEEMGMQGEVLHHACICMCSGRCDDRRGCGCTDGTITAMK